MSQTDRATKLTVDEIEADTAPALELLWKIHCQAQGHPCHYGDDRINAAVNGILRLREKARLRYEDGLGNPA